MHHHWVLVFVNFYRQFIRNFSQTVTCYISSPPQFPSPSGSQRPRQPSRPYYLSSPSPILQKPDLKLQFIIEVDTLEMGFLAVLFQHFPEGPSIHLLFPETEGIPKMLQERSVLYTVTCWCDLSSSCLLGSTLSLYKYTETVCICVCVIVILAVSPVLFCLASDMFALCWHMVLWPSAPQPDTQAVCVCGIVLS